MLSIRRNQKRLKPKLSRYFNSELAIFSPIIHNCGGINFLFQIQAKVRAQQESSDKNLKALHEQLVVKKPVAKSEKAKLPQKKVKKAAPSTSKVQDDLKKMNVD